ncbi:hypothetical protein HAX54_003582 [Datura stramonium]|uniref:Uncharacterized protein n=1 Tax=Datura stramonium TaxID=4076 RepID=A0ABS8WX67_DATST|nr:hypothetical protein [Datura stramonium]
MVLCLTHDPRPNVDQNLTPTLVSNRDKRPTPARTRFGHLGYLGRGQDRGLVLGPAREMGGSDTKSLSDLIPELRLGSSTKSVDKLGSRSCENNIAFDEE